MDYSKIFGTGNKPTAEQNLIAEAYARGENICVEARAGASKSSTSTMLSFMFSDKKILYTAFNKKVIEDGRGSFNYNTDCRTNHSIAYREVGYEYQHKLSRPKGRYVNVAGTIAEISRYLKIADMENCNSFRIASFVSQTISSFESSAENKLGNEHVPHSAIKDYIKKHKEVDKNALVKVVLRQARKLWRVKIDLDSPVIMSHDTYLKLYQLSEPVIKDYDVVLLDECQDATACVIDIILRQEHMQRVVIGDSHQAIYQWRGCINTFTDPRLVDYTKLTLSQSFRFGQNLADVAKKILGGVEITGFTVDTKLQDIPDGVPYTAIYRTNTNLVLDALQFIADGKKVKMEVDVRDFVKLLQGIVDLLQGKKPKHADLVIYDGDVEEFLLDCEYNPEFKRLLKFVQSGQAFSILSALKGYVAPLNPDITLITSHKSKGMTIDHVVLADDFVPLLDKYGNLNPAVYIGEINLLYVAVTRAKLTLQVNKQVQELLEYYEDRKHVKGVPLQVKGLMRLQDTFAGENNYG